MDEQERIAAAKAEVRADIDDWHDLLQRGANSLLVAHGGAMLLGGAHHPPTARRIVAQKSTVRFSPEASNARSRHCGAKCIRPSL